MRVFRKGLRRDVYRFLQKLFNSLVIFAMVMQPVGTAGVWNIATAADTAPDAQVTSDAPADPPVVKEEDKTTPAEEVTPPKEEVAKEEPAPAVVPEVAPATEEIAPTVTEPATETTPTPEEATVPATTDTTEPTVAPTDDLSGQVCLGKDDAIKDSSADDWTVNEDKNKAETKDKVALGVTYTFPLDKDVKVTFTCLPKDESKRAPLTIERIHASDITLPDGVVAATEYAYDIKTEGMDNGDFKYDLSLPKSDVAGAEVKYIEQSADEVVASDVTKDELKAVDEKKVEEKTDSVTVSDLDHFTIFVVVANQTISVAASGVGTPDNGWVSDNNYATFNGQDDWAEYGFPDITVPAGATVDGIEVLVEGKTTGRDLDVSLWNTSNSNPDTYTSPKTANLSGSDTTQTLGGAADKWGKTWTSADFADATFKVRVDANSDPNTTASLDQVQVKVYYTVPPQDLTVTKTNSVGGNTVVGTPFNWVLTITNSGTATATFGNGSTVLTDQLPTSGATYGSPVETTNNFGCTLVNSNLNCTASGTLNIPASGTIVVTIPVTPTAAGSLVNPRNQGICSVDPNNNIAESNNNNNSCAANTVTVAAYQVTPNPSLPPQACGLDIALVMDNSQSVTTAQRTQMKNALTAFTGALAGTPTQFSVTIFGNSASVAQSFTANTTLVNNAINSLPANPTGEYTNWEAGLNTAAGTFPNRAGIPGLMILATDGDPTASSAGASGPISEAGYTFHLPPAVVATNNAKSAGTRILALGIGTPSLSRLQAISGPNTNTGNVLTSDVITTNFDNLAAQLATFAEQTCGRTVTVTKKIDADGDLQTTGDQTTASGWTFDIGGQTGQVTDADGKTPAVTLAAGSNYSVTETAQGGYGLLSAVCTGAADHGTQDLVNNRVFGIEIASGDVVSCTFINAQNKGSITIVKDAQPDDVQDFSFTGTAPFDSFSLDDDADVTLSNSKTMSGLLPGAYSITENPTAGWALKDVVCTSNLQLLATTTDATIDITLAPGENITCTYANTKNPVCGDGIVNQTSEQCDGAVGVTPGSNFCTATCQLIPIYDGPNSCPVDKPVKRLVGTDFVSSTDTNGITVPVTSGTTYLFEASGTFIPTSAPGYESDAAYTKVNGVVASQYGIHGTGNDYAAHALLGDLGSGVGVIDWGTQTDTHIYNEAYTPSTSYNAQFVIGDRYSNWFVTPWQNQSGMNDNSGSLTLKTYECVQEGSISGIKFEDKNWNGVKNSDEGGLSGWTIFIDENGNETKDGNDQSTTTVSGGAYSFAGITPGTYSICEVPKAGWQSSLAGGTNCQDAVVSAGQDIQVRFGNYQVGSVTVCKLIVDPSGNVVDGSALPGSQFTISGFTPAPVTSQGAPAGVLPTSTFTTGLSLNTQILKGAARNDAQCVTYDNLKLGGYYYGQETINVPGWENPKYNDQFTVKVNTINDLFPYDGNLFDGNQADDGSRNQNVDGHLVLSSSRPNRTLVVLNQYKPAIVSAQKVMCDDESYLPNMNGGADITATTASTFVANSNGHCHIQENWNFQWSVNGGSFGSFQTDTSSLGSPWQTFSSQVTLPPNVLGQKVEVREVFPDDTYVPFSNGSDVSAEIYCADDVANYDNWEWIQNIQAGSTYYCVAFNAKKKGTLRVVKNLINDNGGTKTNQDFSFHVDGGSATPFEADGTNEMPVLAGTYNVTEVADAGYDTTYQYNQSNSCAQVVVPAGGVATCTITNNDKPPVTVIASKIVCDNESDLPNRNGGADIAATTAANYVATHPSCHLVPGWKFQWGYDAVSNPGDAYVGEAGSGWTTFGPTVSDGTASVSIANPTGGRLKIREVLQDGYLPFTYTTHGNTNVDNVTAELYCSNDVVNYDNEEWLNTPQNGQTYHCVAWNVLKTGTITGFKWNDLNGNGSQNGEEPKLADWTIFIDTNKDGVNNDGISTTTTGDGSYSFPNLAPGTYRVCEAQQTGWTQTFPQNQIHNCHDVVVTPGQTSGDNNFGNFQLGKVSGEKFEDSNGDGNTAEDSGLDNWTIVLGKSTLVKTESVNSASDTPVNLGTFASGKSYLVTAEGTFDAGDSITADAECSTRLGTPWHTLVNNYESYGETLLDLQIDGAATDWGACNTGHIYSKIFTGDNLTHSALISDIYKPNNSGSLTVNVYALSDVVTDVTSNGGLYDFANLTAGNYTLCEVQQSNWTQTAPTSACHWFTVGSGFDGKYDFANFHPGTITGIKYNDCDGNGKQDGEVDSSVAENDGPVVCQETGLAGWTIYLDLNHNGSWDANEPKTVTDENGAYSFTGLLSDNYSVQEVNQEGWVQRENRCEGPAVEGNGRSFVSLDHVLSGVDITSGDNETCLIGNMRTPTLSIEKWNDSGATEHPGNTVRYHIKVTAHHNSVHGVHVTDLPPAGFIYVPGSGTGAPFFHEYASPGVWDLGDMADGQSIELAYDTKISDTQDSGDYKDLAYARGTSGTNDPVLANDPTPFVGTNVEVAIVDTPDTVLVPQDDEHKLVEKTKKKTEYVLGAATTLPMTGANTGFLALALALLLGGIGLIVLSKSRRRKQLLTQSASTTQTMMKFFLAAILAGSALLYGQTASAASLSVQIETPQAVVSSPDFKIGFVTLDIEDPARDITIECWKAGDGAAFETHALSAGGNSGDCQVSATVIPADGDYEFYVKAVTTSGASETAESNHVNVKLVSTVPGTPYNYDRNDASCQNTITFTTAADAGKTVKVELYRSLSTSFTADASTKVDELAIGSDASGSFVEAAPGCSNDSFYALRAVDVYGNGSGFVGDKDVHVDTNTVTHNKTKTVTIPGTAPTGAIAVTGAEGAATGGVQGAETTNEENAGTQPAGGSVLGEATEAVGAAAGGFLNWIQNHPWWSALIALIVLALGYYGYGGYQRKHNEPLQ